MSTAISGRIALLRLSTSTPDMSERERSTSATSKGEARTCAIASSPVRASPATSMSTRPEKTCFRPIRTTSWSSTMSSRIIVRCPTGEVHLGITALVPAGGIVGVDGFLCRNNPTPDRLKGIAEDNAVSPYGNVLARESGEVRHVVARWLEHDAPILGVITQRRQFAARRGARLLVQFPRRAERQLGRAPGDLERRVGLAGRRCRGECALVHFHAHRRPLAHPRLQPCPQRPRDYKQRHRVH